MLPAGPPRLLLDARHQSASNTLRPILPKGISAPQPCISVEVRLHGSKLFEIKFPNSPHYSEGNIIETVIAHLAAHRDDALQGNLQRVRRLDTTVPSDGIAFSLSHEWWLQERYSIIQREVRYSRNGQYA
jgi:hypothetical protein